MGGLLQVSLYIAQNSLLAIPAFIGEKGMTNLLYGLIMIAVSLVGSFVLTCIFGFEDEPEETEEAPAAPAEEKKPLVEKIQIMSPVTGTVQEITEVPDAAFSEKVLGDGMAVIPTEGKVYAPADGTVVSISDSKHGIMFRTTQGVELLIHIGLETVQLKGEHYTACVANGAEVKAGDLLVEFDLDAIKAKGYNPVTPVVVTNIDEYIRAVGMMKSGETVEHGSCLMTIV